MQNPISFLNSLKALHLNTPDNLVRSRNTFASLEEDTDEKALAANISTASLFAIS